MMIRDTDATVPKESRAAIANDWSADLYISIHFNSTFPNTKTAGVEVMAFPLRSQRSTDSWSPGKSSDAESSNAPVNAFAAWNTLFGSYLHRHLLEALHSGDRGEKFEHLAVLRGLSCPGILVEPAFLSNETEGPALATAAYRDAIAGAIDAGIRDYAGELAKLRPAPKPAPPPAPGPDPAPAGARARAAAAPLRSLTVSRLEARRYLGRATLLDARAPDVGAAISHLGYIQIDPINVCGRMHDLILRNRVEGYLEGGLTRHIHGPEDGAGHHFSKRPAFEHHIP